MENIADIYIGLSVWKAATLYVGFVENHLSTEGLATHISRKNSFAASNHEQWKSLHRAVKRGDFNKIKRIALESSEEDLPWPRHWVALGEQFEKAHATG